MKLRAVAVEFSRAAAFVGLNHSHHDAPQGHKFSIGCERDGELVGVAIVGRPVNRHLDDGATLEVTRLCTDGTRNVGSFLLGCVRRAATAMGYSALVSYILESEDGTVYKAAGWTMDGTTPGGPKWDLRAGKQLVMDGMAKRRPAEPKKRWVLNLS